MLDQIEQITCTVVDDEMRLECLPKHFGRAFLEYERLVYTYMDHLCPVYQGGYWEFMELGNGGFFMQLREEGLLRLDSPNGSSHEVTARAASIVASLFAVGHLMQKYQTDVLIDKYQQLLDFAAPLDEADKIFQLID